MKRVLPLVLVAALAASAPALADHDRGRGGEGWHGGGGGWRDRGGEPRGEGYGRGGRWGGGGDGGEREGRWRGGMPGPEGGALYAGPPRGSPAPEEFPREQDEARRGVRSGQLQSMGEVVRRLQRRGGRMLDAGLTSGPNGQPAYRVIWAAPDGRRIDYIIDAQTGAILEGR